VILKSLALRGRGENKDAYDLNYVVRNFGAGVEDVASRLRPLLGDACAQRAIEYLAADFMDHDCVGPRRVAEFITGGADDRIQADAVSFVGQMLCLLGT